MPLVKKITTEPGELGIWKITESANDLASNFIFSEFEKDEFDKIKAEKRKTEYISVRLILQEMLGEKQEIKYFKSGKPYLKKSKKNISISHSADFAVVLLSDKKIGIDVENTGRNVEKVAKRFLHRNELNHIESLHKSQEAKIIYWGAKEAIFKCTTEENIEFKEQIIIQPFTIKEEGKFTGTLNKIIGYNLWYMFYENNVIVYCVE